jgi:cell division protease FtsH
VSEHTARLIDEEVRRVIDEAEERARTVLTEHIDDLHRLARGLLEYETLSAEEAQAVMQGQDISRGDGGSGGGAPASKPAASVPNAGRGTKGQGDGGWDPTPQPT